ncbi:MAG: restriction endonuclease subunit S [Clostridiales bacterium]|nr:restriction endonuclease subunit S [Clostridiales bacterium]
MTERQMKDSGIAWVGEIPQDWETRRIKSIFYIIGGNGFNIELQGNESGDYPFCKASDISNAGKFINKAANYVTKQIAIENHYNIVPVKSIVLAKIGEAMKKNNRSISLKECCLDNNCQALVAHRDINYIFSYYLLMCIDMRWFDNAGTIPCVNNRKLLDCKIPFPPIAEQQQIADFLDRECEKIDGLKADIQTQIDTLEQYKRSIITEAVTHGLNPDAPMKDSGIAWVGNLPLEWKIGRIGGLYELRNEKVSDKDFMPLSVTMKGILPQLETAAKTNDGDNRKLVRKGDFAINSRSDRRGSCGISDYDGSVSLINTILKPRKKMNARYYNWLFHTPIFADEFYKWGHGIVDDLWTTGWQEMKRIQIPVPPLDEQQAIAEYLDNKCAEIEQAIADKKAQLDTLDEYKQSLIYEYITGKKEVIDYEL